VVVAYNSRDRLRACVAPLASLPWARVLVVDNASPDRSAEVVSDLSVEVVRAPRNGGFGYGCNLGVSRGHAEFVLLLNPDARLSPEGLRQLLDALAADSVLGAVGPRIVGQTGSLHFSQRRFPRLRSSFSQALFLQRLAPLANWSDELIRDGAAYERHERPDWISGACVLLRRDVAAELGGFDEGFFLYSEETDLFRRMRARGWEVGYVPDVTAHHEGGASAGPELTERHWARSRVRYAFKHHGRLVALLEAAAVALGALTHAAVWLHRPQRARTHVTTARAALTAARALR
jgi:N-acetylglucosaminyl-diphospho-decaprenol L-rhamnosyltransferase